MGVSSLFAVVRKELADATDEATRRLAEALLAAADVLVAKKRERHARVLPLADYFVDRWDKARLLGFGEGSSIYDSCLVIGDVKMGKHGWVGPFTILDGSGGLEIGDHCTVSAGAHVYTHDTVKHALDDAPIERAPVKIGNRVYIGPNSVIARGVIIGDRVVIGANSLVREDVPSGKKVAGNPARIIGDVDSSGAPAE
jgi:acetyltransferase-like isoleucine patch superfamily enzyme